MPQLSVIYVPPSQYYLLFRNQKRQYDSESSDNEEYPDFYDEPSAFNNSWASSEAGGDDEDPLADLESDTDPLGAHDEHCVLEFRRSVQVEPGTEFDFNDGGEVEWEPNDDFESDSDSYEDTDDEEAEVSTCKQKGKSFALSHTENLKIGLRHFVPILYNVVA